MDQNLHIWQTWAETLNRWGMKSLTATFLEASGPLSLIGAQLVYFGQPFLTPFFPKAHLNALADLLENPQETQSFVALLRQTDTPLGS